MAEIGRAHGRLDGIVNNAGIGTPGDVEPTTFSEWRRVMAVNADGVFWAASTPCRCWPCRRRPRSSTFPRPRASSEAPTSPPTTLRRARYAAQQVLALYAPQKCGGALHLGASGLHRRRHGGLDRAQPADQEKRATSSTPRSPRPPGPAARGCQHGGVAAVGGILVHDGIGGVGRRRLDRQVASTSGACLTCPSGRGRGAAWE